MKRAIISIYTYFQSRRKVLFLSLALLLAGFVFLLLRLEYKEDISDFLPKSENNERVNAVYQHIGSSDKLIINFSSKDAANNTDEIIEAIDNFTLLLEEADSLCVIPEIVSQIDETQMFELTGFIQQNAPYFLTPSDYQRIDTLLSEQFVAKRLREAKRLLMLPSGGIMEGNITNDPLQLFSSLLLKLQDFQLGDSQYELRDGYLFSKNTDKGMVIITSPFGMGETANNTALLSMVENTIKEVNQLQPDVSISCFGAPAIAVTNATQIKKDSILAISLSLVLILLLLIYFFRNARNLFLVFFSVLFGWLLALALLAIFKGSMSIIAIGVGSIFIGIAVNYSLHLIDHIKHKSDVKDALREIVSPLLIGNITTVSAFLSLLFIRSEAMRDLGLFASLLLLGTIFFVLIYLPHLVKVRTTKMSSERLIFGKIANFAPEKNKWIVWSVLVLTILFLYLSQFTTFESDMNKINYMTEQQRKDMQEMLQSLENKDKNIIYFVSEGQRLNDALIHYERHKNRLDSLLGSGLISKISGIGNFLLSKEEQQKRIQVWNAFWESRKDNLLRQIDEAAAKEGVREGAFEPFYQLLRADLIVQEEDYFAPIVSLLAKNYVVNENEKSMVISLLYCEKERTAELENALKQTSLSETFFFDSRDFGQRMVDTLSDDFNFVLYICGFIVFIFLTLSFGRLELSLLSFLPLAVSWVWILGLMQLGNIQFNIINIILATFIFGQGDDYTIFVTEGLMYEYTYRRKMLASYKNSIILSALIMLTGIGTLIFAKHPAMRSLAEVTIVGMFSVVMMAYIIPPLLFNRLTKKRGEYREIPLTFKRVFASVYAFLFFLIGSLVITIVGFFLFGIGKPNEKKKLFYHKILCWISDFVIKRVPFVKFNYQNIANETFEKPAIIISNHQSHLDLMCLMMLTPRLVILTNDWVWNNPFYGKLIKYADFYPVSSSPEQMLEKLSERVKNGYSIVVFPEGTRSENGSILRFHKGAFYLAEQLNLDIIPVLLHGVGHVLPKKDFMLREGFVTVQVQPHITPVDSRFAAGYVARTKQVRRYYRDMYTALSKQLETATYFKSFVMHNYIYKGVGIERGARAEFTHLKKSKMLDFIDAYQGDSPVLIENNGYGVCSFLFALVHKNIQVVATEQDAEKVAIARNCSGLPSNLTICENDEYSEDMKFEVRIDASK